MDAKSVIEGLNDIHAVACGLGDDECYLNSIGIKQLQALIDGATELLKAQEPRVMTLEEVKQHNDPIFIECKWRRDWALRSCYVENTIYFAVGWRNGSSEHLNADSYGITWRCWTSQPSDEQREAEPWE